MALPWKEKDCGALDYILAAAPSPRPKAGSFLAIVIAVATLFVPETASLGDSMPDEHQQKANFLLNFARFIEWPTNAFASAKDPFTVALFGEVPFAGTVERHMVGRKIRGRQVVVHQPKDVEEIQPCQILFVGPDEDAHLEAIFARIQSKPVLTVGESKAFVNRRGCIQLICDEGRVSFRLNLDAALSAKLTISSKLIRIAKPIYISPETLVEPKRDSIP
jgi:hypothetical protein